VAALVAAWLAVRPHETHLIDAIAWLEARPEMRQLKAALRAQLRHLWADAYRSGLGDASVPDQVVQDQVGAMQATWLNEVTETRVKRIAEILAAGGTAAALAAAILALLRSPSGALKVATTETYRAANLGALDAYRRARVNRVRWVTRSAHPCPICLANEAEGPKHLGEPFSSGDQAPPAHPNCECVLVPADGE
jgi:hypothetical protein